ncbi:MAG: AsmA-like C-terminal region-containing protein [Ferruginibacter sp.]
MVKGLEREDENSKIVVDNFVAKWHGLPVTSPSIEILNLVTPLLTTKINSIFPLTSLNELMGSNVLLFKDGVGVMDLNYSGPVEKNDNTNSFLNGNVSISNGLLTYLPRGVDMTKVSSKILFKDSDIFISNLSTEVLGQQIIMNGEGKKLLSLINSAPQKAIISWNIYSPSLNLTPFSFLLQEKKKKTVNKKGLVETANKMDNILEDATLDVTFKSPKIKYKNFTAENVEAKILLLPDMYSLKNISMRHAGGHLNLNGSITGLNKNRHELNLNANFKGVNVQTVFYSFDNFGQKGIESNNLEGKLTAKIKATAVLDKEGKVSPSSINSIIDFSLNDGSLINYEPIKKIQQFVFKQRDFDNIKFAELKDRLEINNGEIKIGKMEIQSSVLTLIVQGLYSNKGNTDISIQVPLSNLKKRAKDFDPQNKGVDKKFGTSVFLRGKTGSDGNVEFKLDLFNKFKKDKERSDKN